jgi:hypothetical protein
MLREKMYVEYPVAISLEQAIKWMQDGNECWQEDSNDWPSCGGFDTVEDLKYNFPDGLDKTYNIHLVPKVAEQAPLFTVGDEIVSTKDLKYCCKVTISKGLVCKVNRIKVDSSGEQKLFLDDHPDTFGPWGASNFVYNVCGDGD